MAHVTQERVGPPIEQLSDCPESMRKICKEIATIRGWEVNEVWRIIRSSTILFGTTYYDYARYALKAVKFNALLRRHHTPLA